MSEFDSNPFAEPASDNPFNVSVFSVRFCLIAGKAQSSLAADISFVKRKLVGRIWGRDLLLLSRKPFGKNG